MKPIPPIYRLICGVLIFHLLGCEDRAATTQVEKIDASAQTDVMRLLDGIHSSNPEIRISSVIALGELGELGELGDQTDIVIKDLILLLNDSTVPDYKQEWPPTVGGKAADALAKIGGKSIPLLLDALQNKDDIVRGYAARVLGMIGDPSAVAGLSKLLFDDQNPDVRRMATRALGQIGDRRALASLQEALKDKENTVVWSAISAIGEIGDPTMIEHLTPFLNSDGLDIPEAAGWAIEKIKINTSTQTEVVRLLDGIHSSNPESRMSSVSALCELGRDRDGELGDQSDIVIKDLILLLRDSTVPSTQGYWPSGTIGAEAALALGQMDDKSLHPLLDALKNKDHIVRGNAAIALGFIGNPPAVAGLSKVLIDDPDPSVRLNAADALGEIGDRRALASLQKALKDKDTKVVVSAIRAIGEIGDPTMIEHLTPLLNSDGQDVAEVAGAVIEQLNDKAH